MRRIGRIEQRLKPPLNYPVKVLWVLERAQLVCMAGVIVFLMFFTAAEVFARYLGHPIPGHYEVVELMIPVLAFLGLAYVQGSRSHVRVELLIDKLHGRVYHFVESLWLLLALCLFVLLAVFTFRNAAAAYQIGHTTPLYRLPTWGTRTTVFIGCAAMCFRLLIDLTQNLIQLVKGIERKELNRTREAAG